MAELFLADDTVLKRRVVLKRVLPYLTSEPEFLQMFLDEARIAAQLQHPNIVETFELGSLEGQIFLSMEFVDGVDLRKLMQEQQQRRGGPLPTRIAAGILQRVAGALGHAHSASGVDGKPLQVIHRDVSPQNVMVGYDGQIKLVDFGIAKATSAMALSQPGVIKGKFLYLSPEQLAPERLDTRSDLFAFGSMLYETSTGKAPFQRQTTEAIIVAIKLEHPVPLQEVMASYPPELAQIVMRCLEKNREERFQSGFDIERALQSYLARNGGPVTGREIAQYVAGLLERPLPELPPELAASSLYAADFDEATAMAKDADLIRARTHGQMPAVRAPGTMDIPVRRVTVERRGATAQGESTSTSTGPGLAGSRPTPRERPALVAPPVQRTASLSEFKAVATPAPRVPGGAVPTGRVSNPAPTAPLVAGPTPTLDEVGSSGVVRGPALIRHPTLELRAVTEPPVPPPPPPATGVVDRLTATPSGLTAPPAPKRAPPERIGSPPPPPVSEPFHGSIPEDDDDEESTSLMDLQQMGGPADGGDSMFAPQGAAGGQSILEDEESTRLVDDGDAAHEPPTGRQALPDDAASQDDDDEGMTQAQDFSSVMSGFKDVDLGAADRLGGGAAGENTSTESSARDLRERAARHAADAKGVGAYPEDPRGFEDDRGFGDEGRSPHPPGPGLALDGRGFDDERGYDDDRDDADDRDLEEDDRGFADEDRGFDDERDDADDRGFHADDRGGDDDVDRDFEDDEDEGTAALPRESGHRGAARRRDDDLDDADAGDPGAYDGEGDELDEEEEDTGRDAVVAPQVQRAASPRSAARKAGPSASGSNTPLIIGASVGGLLLLVLIVWMLWPSAEPSREARPISPMGPVSGAVTPTPEPTDRPAAAGEVAETPAGTGDASPTQQAPEQAQDSADRPVSGPPSAAAIAGAVADGESPEPPPPPTPTAEPVAPPSAAPNPVAPPPASSLPQGTGQDGLARIRLEVPPGVKVTSEGKVLETGGVVMVPPGPVELKLQCTSIRARPFTYWIRVDEGSSSVQRFAVKCENQPLR